MKKHLPYLIAASFFFTPAIAADKVSDPQCIQEAKTLKGDEREKALKACEKSPAQLAQQNRMKNCHAEAKKKDLHGDERRAFMSTCLKG